MQHHHVSVGLTLSHHADNHLGAAQDAARSPKAVLAPIIASTAFVLELTLVPLLLPMIQQQFGLTISDLAWVFNAYGLAVAMGVLLGGWFGDIFGTRTVFTVGAVGFASGSLLVAISGNFEMLLAGRILQGLGGGIFSPLVPILLTRASPEKPGWILIIWGSVTGYVAAVVPLVYGHFAGTDRWEGAFMFIAFLTICAAFIIFEPRSVKETVTRAPQEKNYALLVGSRDLWAMFCYVFCTYGAITFYLFRLPVWLTASGFDAVSIGFLISIMWFSFATVGTLLRNKVDKAVLYKIMLAAPVLIAAGLSLSFFDAPLLVLALASILIGSGLACSNAPSTQMILSFAPKGMTAISASLDITFARVGGVATVAILAPAEFIFAIPAIVLLCALGFVCGLIAIKGHLLLQYRSQTP